MIDYMWRTVLTLLADKGLRKYLSNFFMRFGLINLGFVPIIVGGLSRDNSGLTGVLAGGMCFVLSLFHFYVGAWVSMES